MKNRREDVSITAREGVRMERTCLDLAPLSSWTPDVYCRGCIGYADVNLFDPMADGGRNFVMYICNCFERDTA